VSVALVTAVLALLVSGLGGSDGGDTPTWLAVVLLALGVVLLVLAARSWSSRPRPGDAPRPLPGWMRALDGMTPAKALRTGVLLGGLNPKNMLLLAAGEAAIAQTEISTTQQIWALVVLVVVGSLGVLLPVIVYLALGSRARTLLDRFKDWMVANTGAIMAVVFLVIGVLLIADGVSALGS
jgi:threonine/homoserine/homoserine lactone efflux protein